LLETEWIVSKEIGNNAMSDIGRISVSTSLQKKKTGLVLEGGAMRGMYTAGVLDVFMDNGITFDGVIGTSMGAITGCSYVSGQKGRTIRYNKKYCKDKRYMSFYSLLTTGDMVGNQFCYHELPEKLDLYDNEAFKRSGTEFYVTCTNVETGEAEYIKVNDMVEEILRLEQQGKVFVIRPETPLDIGRMSHDVKKIEGAYERGRADGLASLQRMLKWLESEEG